MHVSTLAAGLAVALAALSASAQESQVDLARRELITQAQQARTDGDHARALDLASRAGQLRMTPSLRMLVAQEHEALGHVLESLDQAVRCVQETDANPALNDRVRIRSTCEALVAALRPRVGHVTVRVGPPVPRGLRLRVQGVEVSPALWNLPFPVIPGEVGVEASAPGRRTLRRTVPVAGGADAEVALVFAPETVVARRGPGAGPWFLAGAGAVVLGAAGIFFALRNSAVDERDALTDATRQACDRDPLQCDYAPARARDDRARTFNLLTNVALGVGAASLVGATLWFVLGRRHGEAPPRAAWRWDVHPIAGGAVLGLSGTL